MKKLRLYRLALGEAGGSPWRNWSLSVGLAVGVFFLVYFIGVADQVESILKKKVVGSLPDRIKVVPSTLSLGPLKLENQTNDNLIKRLQRIQGVKTVYRQAHLPLPCQLFASYGGEQLTTDLIVEGVDPGQVAPDVAAGYTFTDPGEGRTIPAIVPQSLLDILNTGLTINTGLPQLSNDALIGKHFTLRVGTSSFNPGPYKTVRCIIVGVSDQIGFGGPALPLNTIKRWSKSPLQYHTLTIQLTDPSVMEHVVKQLKSLKLHTPGLETAAKIATAATYIRIIITLVCAAILLVAAIGIATGFNFQVKEEAQFIGLYRALGATRSDIATIYLTQAILLSATGAAAGAIAAILAGIVSNLYLAPHLPPGFAEQGIYTFNAWIVLFGISFGVISGILASYWPSRKAAEMHPVACLRKD